MRGVNGGVSLLGITAAISTVIACCFFLSTLLSCRFLFLCSLLIMFLLSILSYFLLFLSCPYPLSFFLSPALSHFLL